LRIKQYLLGGGGSYFGQVIRLFDLYPYGQRKKEEEREVKKAQA
jgi:hypothetical protein